ncbi:MAG: leishmanolysin-related zinc metalloendopeptidase [Longimicrobiaceae bacterium]
MRPYLRPCALVLALASAACTGDAARGTLPPPATPPAPLGVYEIAVTGIGTNEPHSTITSVRGGGPRATLTTAGSGLVFEQTGGSSFTEGARGAGGQRYVNFTYRVRNGTGAALNNLTLLMVSRANTVAGTPLSTLKRFDGSAADPAIASYVVPTGAAAMRADLVTLQALDPDVIQVFTESEVAAITPPGDVTGIFPYGYVVRSANPAATSRALPAATSPNQYDGVLTLSFRLPLQATSSADVYSFFFEILAVQDSETRMTESIEEGQDTGAVRRLRERAAALGATTVTVLAGSPASGPEVEDYPGQRQICSVRTAGTAAAPVRTITTPAAYTRLAVMRNGESPNACWANFRIGSPTRPTPNVAYPLTARAMDRYGNVITTAADTVALSQASGPAATFSAPAALASGTASLSVTWQANGTSALTAAGRRLRGERTVEVATEATVVVNGGDNQAAMAGSSVPTAPSVRVRDLANAPLAGVPVTFKVTSGGGYVTGATAVTNASGIATAGSWVLGAPAALNTLSATAAGAGTPATFSAAGCGGREGTGFGITLCYRSVVTPTQRANFEAGVARWEEIITGDLPDLAYTGAAGSCSTGSPSFNLSIDDLLVFASIEPIDGAGSTIGFANTCYVRTGAQPFVGYIRLDAADMATMEGNGLLLRIIQHELGHALGIGTLWPAFGYLVNPSTVGGPAVDTYYSGPQGIAGFNQVGGSTYTGGSKVPVENSGSAGRINGHWRETVLLTELMTPTLTVGALPISLVSVRSLTDLGYAVDTAKADAFFVTLSLRGEGAPSGGVELGNDVAPGPLYSVDPRGRTVRIR